MSSSQPTTPLSQRKRYSGGNEKHTSRIPISLSPVPYRRSSSTTRVRMSTTNSTSNNNNNRTLLNEITLNEHNKNLLRSRNTIDRNHQLLSKFNRHSRRDSSMDTKSDSNDVDSGGGSDEIDKSANHKHCNGNLARKSSCNGKIDRGMVSKEACELSTSLDLCQSLPKSMLACCTLKNLSSENMKKVSFHLQQYYVTQNFQGGKKKLSLKFWLTKTY